MIDNMIWYKAILMMSFNMPAEISWNLAAHRVLTLQWRHNERDGVSSHQPHDCLPNRLFRRRSKKTPKPRVTGLCEGNLPVTGEFPAQMASYAENVSIWLRHRVHTYVTSSTWLDREPLKSKDPRVMLSDFSTRIFSMMLIPVKYIHILKT